MLLLYEILVPQKLYIQKKSTFTRLRPPAVRPCPSISEGSSSDHRCFETAFEVPSNGNNYFGSETKGTNGPVTPLDSFLAVALAFPPPQ